MLKAWDLISTVALIIVAAIVFACLPAGAPEDAQPSGTVRAAVVGR